MQNKSELCSLYKMPEGKRKLRRTSRPELIPLNIPKIPIDIPILIDGCIKETLELSPSQIYPWLYLGTIEDACDSDELSRLNIKNIVSIGPLPKESDTIKNLYINIDDHGDEPIANYFDEICEFLDKVKDKDEKVLVHCRGGVSRSATAVIAYHMKTSQNHKLDDAVDFVRSKRSIINPNLGFVIALMDYEKEFHRKSNISCSICGKDNITEDIKMHLIIRHNMSFA